MFPLNSVIKHKLQIYIFKILKRIYLAASSLGVSMDFFVLVWEQLGFQQPENRFGYIFLQL